MHKKATITIIIFLGFLWLINVQMIRLTYKTTHLTKHNFPALSRKNDIRAKINLHQIYRKNIKLGNKLFCFRIKFILDFNYY